MKSINECVEKCLKLSNPEEIDNFLDILLRDEEIDDDIYIKVKKLIALDINKINNVVEKTEPQQLNKLEKKPLMNFHKMKIGSLKDLPPRIFLVERLGIEKGMFNLICAAGSSGKTMFLQYLACCISSGKPMFGEFPVMQGDVIHIDQEQSLTTTLRRYYRIGAGLGLDSLNIERVNLSRRLDCLEEIDTIEEQLVEQFSGKTLAIIDSLKAISEADENSPEIRIICDILKRVAERCGCTIILIHHKGKVATGARQTGRGHSSIYDSADGQLDLDRDRDTDTYELSCSKARDMREFDGLRYALKDEGDFSFEQKCSEKLTFELLISNVKPKKDIGNLIMTSINESAEKLNQGDLFKIVKGDRETFKKMLDNLETKKYISTEKGLKGALFYHLTDMGKKQLEEWS